MTNIIEKEIIENQSITDTNAVFLLGNIMDDPLMEIDRDHYIKVANPAAKRLLGDNFCLLYTSPSPRDLSTSRMPSSA